MKRTKAPKKSLKRLYTVIAIVLLVVLVTTLLEATNTTHFFHKSAVVRAPTAPLAKLPTEAQPNAGNKTSSANNGVAEGVPTDKNGQVPSSGVPTNPSQWSKSASGVITVKLPLANSTLSQNATLTGSASISQVQYRLIDDAVGVISQGPISVVNGNFTASLSFTAHSPTGRLDVFSTEPSGKEINEVQIPVRF